MTTVNAPQNSRNAGVRSLSCHNLKFNHAVARGRVFHMRKNFRTPLHVAAENSGTEMMKLLIENVSDT